MSAKTLFDMNIPNGPDRYSDFMTYDTAAVLLASGASPYDVGLQLDRRAKLTGVPPDPSANLFYFLPPSFLVIMLPFTRLPVSIASALWQGIQLFVVCSRCLYLLRGHLSRWGRFILLTWVIAWVPVAACLKFGQLSLILLLAFLELSRAIERNRQVAGGLWLSVLFVKPVLLLPPALLLVHLRWWKCLLVSVMSIIGVTLVALLFRPTLLHEYVDATRAAVALQASNEVWRVSTFSLASIARFFGFAEGPVSLALAAVVLWLWIRVLQVRGTVDGASTTAVVALLLSPHVFIYDLALGLAAIPAITRRPSPLAAPLLMGGLLIPGIARTFFVPSLATLWLLLILVFVLRVAPREADRNPTVGECEPSSRRLAG